MVAITNAPDLLTLSSPRLAFFFPPSILPNHLVSIFTRGALPSLPTYADRLHRIYCYLHTELNRPRTSRPSTAHHGSVYQPQLARYVDSTILYTVCPSNVERGAFYFAGHRSAEDGAMLQLFSSRLAGVARGASYHHCPAWTAKSAHRRRIYL